MDKYYAYSYVVNGIQKDLFTDIDMNGGGEAGGEGDYAEYRRKQREYGSMGSTSSTSSIEDQEDKEPYYCGRIVHSSNGTSMNSLISTGKIAMELWRGMTSSSTTTSANGATAASAKRAPTVQLITGP